MTRPTDIKPREGEVRGTRFEEYVIHDPLPELRFTITPDVVREYAVAVEGEASGYERNGGKVALPSVLAPYLMAVLYRKYPPAQGGIMASNVFRFYSPISAEIDTEIVADGRIEETFEKKGRKYVRYSANFRTPDGDLVAQAVNTSTFPS
jgi:hypothetical protein